MKKILFFSSLLPNEIEDKLSEHSKGAMSNANSSLQYSYLFGLADNDVTCEIINVPNLGGYPFRYKKIVVSKSEVHVNENIKGVSLGFINIVLIKHFFIFIKLLWSLRKIDVSSYSYCVIYDLYPPFMLLNKLIKFRYRRMKSVIIVPDLVGLTFDKDNRILRVYSIIKKKIVNYLLDFFDGYVLLVKKMAEQIKQCVGDNSIVIEGILNPDINYIEKSYNSSDNIILYTGSLDKRHGIINLVNAFCLANMTEFELHIYGDGDGRDFLIDAIKSHGNIKYFGQVPRREVVIAQSKAMLLVNPRGSTDIFTQFSFPSKVMEYFYSGTATFMYRLSGIPEEYYEHCFSLEDESVGALVTFFNGFKEESIGLIIEKGKSARKFVAEKKNAKRQTERLVNFLGRL